jgi:transposase-like protein
MARAVEEVYPDARIQRCLTHIHRKVRGNLSKNPKTKA